MSMSFTFVDFSSCNNDESSDCVVYAVTKTKENLYHHSSIVRRVQMKTMF
jgi:hypothetical protein